MAHTLFDQEFAVINHNWQTLHQYTGSHICWHFDFFGVWHFCLGTCWHLVSMTWRHSSWGTFLHSNRFAVRQTGGFGSRWNVLHFSFGTCNNTVDKLRLMDMSYINRIRMDIVKHVLFQVKCNKPPLYDYCVAFSRLNKYTI